MEPLLCCLEPSLDWATVRPASLLRSSDRPSLPSELLLHTTWQPVSHSRFLGPPTPYSVWCTSSPPTSQSTTSPPPLARSLSEPRPSSQKTFPLFFLLPLLRNLLIFSPSFFLLIHSTFPLPLFLFPLTSPSSASFSQIIQHIFYHGCVDQPFLFFSYTSLLLSNLSPSCRFPPPSWSACGWNPFRNQLSHNHLPPRPRNDQTSNRFLVVNPPTEPERTHKRHDTAIFLAASTLLRRTRGPAFRLPRLFRHGSSSIQPGQQHAGQEDYRPREEIQMPILQSCIQQK